jgi:hypothetical protein
VLADKSILESKDLLSLSREKLKKKKNSRSRGPGVNEVVVRSRSPPQSAQHTVSEHRGYWPSLEGGLYGRGGK